jgi:hypothetical protein
MTAVLITVAEIEIPTKIFGMSDSVLTGMESLTFKEETGE